MERWTFLAANSGQCKQASFIKMAGEPNDEQNPIDRLKTSALRADRIILFLSIWVETREGHTYANHHL